MILTGGVAAPAHAGNPADCHKPPPAWYTAPRVTHTYSVTYGAGYGRHSPRYFSSRGNRYRHASNQ